MTIEYSPLSWKINILPSLYKSNPRKMKVPSTSLLYIVHPSLFNIPSLNLFYRDFLGTQFHGNNWALRTCLCKAFSVEAEIKFAWFSTLCWLVQKKEPRFPLPQHYKDKPLRVYRIVKKRGIYYCQSCTTLRQLDMEVNAFSSIEFIFLLYICRPHNKGPPKCMHQFETTWYRKAMLSSPFNSIFF